MNQLTAKQRHWLELIRTWQTSGLNQTTFCRRQDIDLNQFYYWKHILDKKGYIETDGEQNAFLPITLVNRQEKASTVTLSLSGVDIQHP